MRRVEPRCRITSSRRADGGGSPGSGGPAGHGSPSSSTSPACCACVTSGNSNGAWSTAPSAASPVGRIAGPPPSATSATGNSCTPSAPTSRATLGVREARPQLRRHGVREGQRLREHRARVPVDVAEAALGVAPARAPGHARDDQRRRLAVRRRPDLSERMPDRVVPVDAVVEATDAAGRDVELEREAAAGRARGAVEQGRPVLALGHPHDTGREVQQPRERGEVERHRLRRPAGQHGGRRGRDRRPLARQLDRGQPGRVRLAGRGPAREVVGHEVLHDAGVLDRDGELALGRVRGEAVIEARRLARSHDAQSRKR